LSAEPDGFGFFYGWVERNGEVLGNPNGARALQRAGKGNATAVAEIRARADRHAQDVLPIVDDIRSAGISGLRGIAAELNARGIPRRAKGNGTRQLSAICWPARVACCEVDA
jgi:hypothetical protein